MKIVFVLIILYAYRLSFWANCPHNNIHTKCLHVNTNYGKCFWKKNKHDTLCSQFSLILVKIVKINDYNIKIKFKKTIFFSKHKCLFIIK